MIALFYEPTLQLGTPKDNHSASNFTFCVIVVITIVDDNLGAEDTAIHFRSHCQLHN